MKLGFKQLIVFLIITFFLLSPVLQNHEEVEAWKGTVDTFVVCEGVDVLVDPAQPFNVRKVFLTSEQGVFAFLRINDVEGPLTLSIEWIDPNGEVYALMEFTPITNASDYTTKISYLDITLVADKFGKWKVNAYANEELISSTDFSLLLSAPLLAVANITLSPGKDLPVYVGSTLTITYTLENVGKELAKNVKIAMEDLEPSEGLIVQRSSDSKELAFNASDDWSLELLGEKPGTYGGKMVLYLDDERVKDWNWTIIISLPELALVDVIIFSKGMEQWPQAGDIITITYIIGNVGKLDAKQIGIDVTSPNDLELINITPAKDIGVNQTAEYMIELMTKKEGDFTLNVALNSFGYKISEEDRTIFVTPRLFDFKIFAILGAVVLFLIILAIVLIKKKRIKI